MIVAAASVQHLLWPIVVWSITAAAIVSLLFVAVVRLVAGLWIFRALAQDVGAHERRETGRRSVRSR